MRTTILSAFVLQASMICSAPAWSQESKTSKDSKPKGTLTLLGTIKGEIDKVSDGGRKLEVKYKEMVSSTTRSNSSSTTTRGSTSGKFRPPVPKEFTQKEKNKEIEVRLLDNPVIRILETSEASAPSKGTDKTKKKNDKEMEKDKKEDKADEDDDKDKIKEKTPAKPSKKSNEPPLPGKQGDLTSLIKGQFIIITVYREDLPGFSRLVANTIYILGEK